MNTTSRRVAALGAIAAQGSQAAASLVLQIVAARALGLSGLGVYAAFYATIVLLTAISTGFVGDTLTVLDRTRPDVRLGLQVSCLTIATVSGVACALGAYLLGAAPWTAALMFGLATFMFIVEDAFRRLLMANILFWRIVAVDLTSLVVSVGVVVAAALLDHHLTVGTIFLALAIGQFAAAAVACWLLPPADRAFHWRRPAALRVVFNYGSWRAVQQAVRPALLAAVKAAALIIAGAVLAGQLEAARIYTSPSMLLVGGMSSFLFASYANKRSMPLAGLLRRTDRDVVMLAVVIVGYSLVTIAALPWLGHLIVGGGVTLSLGAVAGWATYSASVAAVTPYGSLAAVRGRQVAVLGWRVADSALSLVLGLIVLVTTRSVEWVPWVMAIGSLLGGLAIRFVVLRDDPRSAESGRVPGGRHAAPEVVGEATR